MVKVKWRDISYSEAKKCIPLPDRTVMNEENWSRTRGREFEIEVPAVDYRPDDAICDGPWFNVVGGQVVCCPHYAEIGD